MWTRIGSAVGALVALPGDEDWEGPGELLGTVFPLNESERLFMGARHTLPEPPKKAGIMIWAGNERIVRTVVVDQGEVEDQPDLVVLRTELGVPTFGGLATLADEPPVWLDVATAGYPEDAVRNFPEVTLLAVRGLKGYVTRPVIPRDVLLIKGPGMELSFPITSGLSGAPLFVQGPAMASGLVGVCVVNHESSTMLWDEGREEGRTTRTGHRIVEYGLAARLLGNTTIGIVDRPLLELVGLGMMGAGRSV
jgi:hypothetical protein